MSITTLKVVANENNSFKSIYFVDCGYEANFVATLELGYEIEEIKEKKD